MLGSSADQVFTATRPHSPFLQRGASLIESSIAMGLVGIVVFASVSSFGGDISSRISKGIIPTLGGGWGGGAAPGMSDEGAAPQGSSPTSPMIIEPGTGYDSENSVGGIVADPPTDEDESGFSSSSPSDDYSLIGGVDAYTPDEEAGETDTRSSSSATSIDNSYAGGTDAAPPVSEGTNDSSASSTTSSDPSEPLQ